MTTRNELLQDLKTIRYEFQMLAATADRLASGRYSRDTAVKNALIESFALHARALLHFFYWDAKGRNGNSLFGRKQANDVIAEDFFSVHRKTWARRPKTTPTLVRAKHRADKQIAHITHTQRPLNTPKARGKTWHFQTIVKHLSRAMKSFLDNAPQLDTAVSVEIRRTLEHA